jgi:hypothetical protein
MDDVREAVGLTLGNKPAQQPGRNNEDYDEGISS